MRKFGLLFFFSVIVTSGLRAQTAPQWNAAQIRLQMEKLNVLGSVLYVAAHPDDENTRLLAFLSNGKKYRTGYLALTRGDGGQNLVGDEQGSDLGLMRTEELLAARHIDGAEQFFSRANDFGFSKSAKETFEFWGHDRILADAVWVIRKFRPDVIVCRFPEDKRAGHGHHWASAIIAHEAFTAAGDPTKFPEQLKYVKPWKAKRVLWNTFNFGGRNTTGPDQLKIAVGGYSPLLGEGYGELASESRSMNKTQGFGASRSYGESWEYFKTIAGPAPHQTLMDGVNTTWSRVQGGKKIALMIDQALQAYDCDDPQKTVPLLLKIRSAIRQVPDTFWRDHKEKEVDRLILASSGIWMDATSKQPYVVAGQPLDIQTEIISRSRIPVTLESVDVLGESRSVNGKLEDNKLSRTSYQVNVPKKTLISEPYWLLERHPVGYYNIADQLLVGLPENPPSLTVGFNLNIDGVALTATYPVIYKYTDPVRGEVRDPLAVTPPVTANIQNEVYVFTSAAPQQIQVTLQAFKDHVKGVVHLATRGHFNVGHNDQPFSLDHAGDKTILHFTIGPSGAMSSAGTDQLTVQMRVDGKTYDRRIRVISHDYIPAITEFPIAETKLVSVPMTLSSEEIGYIMGAGDKVPEALTQLGYHVKLLSDEELSNGNLQQYDAIIVGIRAYNTRDRLKYVGPRLMDYVKKGGTVVAQYNKNSGLVTRDLGPYPFTIENLRVTDETADVKFLLPGDPVLNKPNKITEKDFEGWIQERGVYFADHLDAHYRAPLAMHDQGESPLDGSLIVTSYGKGKYVYTGLDFFRELPAGVPGAFRLFVNLIEK